MANSQYQVPGDPSRVLVTPGRYGTAALLLAQEAEADEAIAWSVQAKTARWTGGFVEAAEFARRGFEVSGRRRPEWSSPIRKPTQLLCSAMVPEPGRHFIRPNELVKY